MEKEKTLDLGKLEYLILNYSIKDRSFWLKIFEPIEPKFFENIENQNIFRFFKKYFAKYNQIPDVQITINELRNVDTEIISQIYGDSPKETKDYIYDKTLKFIKSSLIRNALIESIDLLEKNEFEEIEVKIKNAVKFNLDVSLGLKLADVDERYEKIKNLETERIPTGFPQFDVILNGGWGRKELYACAAPPGIGKCHTYESEIEIEIEEEDKIYDKIKIYLKS
jgi:replicative DNA helicase